MQPVVVLLGYQPFLISLSRETRGLMTLCFVPSPLVVFPSPGVDNDGCRVSSGTVTIQDIRKVFIKGGYCPRNWAVYGLIACIYSIVEDTASIYKLSVNAVSNHNLHEKKFLLD